MSEMTKDITAMCSAAKAAARQLAGIDDENRSAALVAAARRMRAETGRIIAENEADLAAGREAGLSTALMDRLRLDGPRIEAMAAGVETVAALDDPLAGTLEQWRTEAGLEIARTPIPIGVVAIIYESRPNVTADAASLCIKSGNAVLLKGGKEAIGSNSVIADLFIEELDAAGLPAHTAQLVRSVEREATHVMLAQDELIDLIIPRGGPGLVRAIAEHSRIPVIKHYEGVCHTYVDSSADLGMAADIAFNAKVQRPGVCNAMENLLVHEDAATAFLPLISERLIAAGVELRGCERTRELLPETAAANEEDWTAEYLDLILAVKVVDSLDSAIDFINTHGSGHSDCIVASDEQRAGRFLAAVDSAVVFENASTRFNDGYEFGFGAEVGISTNRLHARGPMGLRELTTYKYVVRGQGQVR
ncbi:MAG: glutamate-5-semialdehyde dehydrogenase [Deltaproteobacteria bacterium]